MEIFRDVDDMLMIRVDKARKNLEDALTFFRNDWNSLSELISHYYPLEILKMAVWEERRIRETRKSDELAKASMRLFPVLLQSIVQSRDFHRDTGFSSNRDIRPKDWNRIKDLGYDAARRLIWYIENWCIIQVGEGKVSKEHFHALRQKVFIQLFNEEMSEEKEVLSSLLLDYVFPDGDTDCETFFHSDPDLFIKSVKKLADIGCNGIDELSAESVSIQMEIRKRAADRKSAGSDLDIETLMKRETTEPDIARRLEKFRRKRDDYDLFSVEENTLLSTETCKTVSLNVASAEGFDFTKDGYFSAIYFPFLRFADRFYTFTANYLYATFPVAIKRIIHRSRESYRYIEKMQNAVNSCVCQMMVETDIPDVWNWRGHRTDVLMLTPVRYLNAFRHPEVFEERLNARDAELKSKARAGHRMLIVDPDSFQPLRKVSDDIWSISLSHLIMVSSDASLAASLYTSVYGDVKEEESDGLDEFFNQDDVYDAEKEEREDAAFRDDEVNDYTLSEDTEFEFDTGDDDEKARAIEAKYSEPDVIPQEEEVKKPSSDEIERLKYDYSLPEKVLEEESEASAFDSFDSDEYEDEEEEVLDSLDDELSDEVDLYSDEEEHFEHPAPESQEVFTDRTPDAALYGDEWEEDDSDQLPLFDSSGAPSAEATGGITLASEEEEEDDEIARDYHRFVAPDDYDDLPASYDEIEKEEEALESGESEESADARQSEEDIAEAVLREVSGETEPASDEEAAPVVLSETDEEEPACVSGLQAAEEPVRESGYDLPEASLEEPASASGPEMLEEAATAGEETHTAAQPEAVPPAVADTVPSEPEKAGAVEEEFRAAFWNDSPSEEVNEEPSLAGHSKEGPMSQLEERILRNEAAEEEMEAAPQEPVITEADEEDEADEADDVIGETAKIAESDQNEEAVEEMEAEEEIANEEIAAAVPSAKRISVLQQKQEPREPVSIAEENTEENPLEEDDSAFFGVLPPLVKQILTGIPAGEGKAFRSFVKDADGDTLVAFSEAVKSCIEKLRNDEKDKILNIDDYKLSVIIAKDDQQDSLKATELQNNVGAVMCSRNATSWTSVIAVFAEDGTLVKVSSEKVTEETYSIADWKIVKALAENLRSRL